MSARENNVAAPTTQPENAGSIILERTLRAPVAMVWQALTDPAQMKQWYFENIQAFKPEVGFQTQVNVHHNGNDFLHLWQVTEVVPEKKISYSWKYPRFPGESLVTFELFGEGDKTRLKLTHRGLETHQPESHPMMERGNFLKGWTHLTGALQAFVEK